MKKHRLFSVLALVSVIVPLILALVPLGMVLAASAPTLSGAVAWNITVSSATINYTLADGGEACQVYIVYGYQSVSTRSSSYSYGNYRNVPEPGFIDRWDFVIDAGLKVSGTYQQDITGLWRQEYISYNVYAYNSKGSKALTAGLCMFDTTLDLEGPVLYYDTGTFAHDSSIKTATWKAQTFNTTDAINFTMVSIYFSSGVNADNVTLHLRAVDGSGYPTGDDFASRTEPSSITQAQWGEFWFDSAVSLNAATQYALVLSCVQTASNYVYHRYDSADGYAAGRMFRSNDSGGTWTVENSTWAARDMVFRIYTRGGFSGIEYVGGYSGWMPTAVITGTAATLRGVLSYTGGVNNTTITAQTATVSFEWGTNTSYGNETTPEAVYSTTYTKGISGLTPATTYHYRFKATNNMGTVYFADRTFTTKDTTKEGYSVVSPGTVTMPHQRNSFYAEGRHWLFYVYSGIARYTSSITGESWGDSVEVAEVSEGSMAITFDGVYVHVLWADRSGPLWYRMGKPNTGGTITWLAAAQEALANPGSGVLWTTSTITTDANGYPWIVAGLCEGTYSEKVAVTTSTAKNGTWTARAGFPTTPGALFGTYYQRGLPIALSDGSMYVVSHKRCYANSWDVTKWDGAGGLVLKGRLWDSATQTWGAVEDVTDTIMMWVGDAAADPMMLFSAVGFGTDVYLVFTNTVMTTAPDSTHNIQFVKRTSGVGWGTETTVQADVKEHTAPVLSVDDAQGNLYCFWGGSPDPHTVYYKMRTEGVWDVSPTDWKFENMLQGSFPGGGGLVDIQVWGRATEGQIGIYYDVMDTTQYSTTTSTGDSYSKEIRLAFMSSGFAVATETAASITGSTATLQGRVVNDDGEACNARFQYGLTATYGSDTTWQTGKETSDLFNQPISGLTPNTTYHFRAQARHPSDGTTVNGADRTFITTSAGAPTVTTGTAVDMTSSGATLQGTVTSMGDSSTVYVSFQYGLSTGYGTSTAEQTKTVTGGFNQAITGLAAGTTYHFRAALRYGSTTIYGSDATFATNALGVPSVSTGSATSITSSSATTQGTITSMGDYGTVYVYFQWGLTTGYGTSTAEQTKTSTGGFSASLSGLSSGTLYYYRAVLRYSATTIYGSQGSFTTTSPPIVPPGGGELAPPDILRIDDVKVFSGYYENGDQLYCINFRIVYTDGNPTVDAGDYFDFVLMDGTVTRAKVPVKSWGYRPGSIYLKASAALAWGGEYTVSIMGNPNRWETPPTDDWILSAGDWQGTDLTQLDTWVISLATALQTYYDVQMVDYDQTPYLTKQGMVVFTMGIPGLCQVRPNICSVSMVYNPTAPGQREVSTVDPNTMVGPEVSEAVSDVAAFLHMDDTNVPGALGFGIAYFVVAILLSIMLGSWGAASGAAGMGFASPILITGAMIGYIPWPLILIIAAVAILYSFLVIWVKGV